MSFSDGVMNPSALRGLLLRLRAIRGEIFGRVHGQVSAFGQVLA